MNRPAVLVMSLLTIFGIVVFVARLSPDLNDPAVQRAVLGGAFLAAGWIATFVFREMGALIDRRQTGVDLQLALLAEIRGYADVLDDGPLEQNQAEVARRVAQGQKTFFPSISPPKIFDVLSSKIDCLPGPVIQPVIDFYALLSDLRLFVEDFRDEGFEDLDDAHQILAYQDYLGMRSVGVSYANEAVLSLEKSIGLIHPTPPNFSPAERSLIDFRRSALNDDLHQMHDRFSKKTAARDAGQVFSEGADGLS